MKTRIFLIPLIFSAFRLSAVTNPVTPSLCEMLGMLDEYISRFDYHTGQPRDSLVERFYPSESELANHFTDLIQSYEKETNVNFSIIKKMGPQGHVYIYSKSLSNHAN